MKEIKKSLKQEVNDPKESKEFTQNDLEEKVAVVKKRIFTLEIMMNEMCVYQIDSNFVNDGLSELKDKI